MQLQCQTSREGKLCDFRMILMVVRKYRDTMVSEAAEICNPDRTKNSIGVYSASATLTLVRNFACLAA